jgi:Fcf2 pre-rRNA processing
MLPTPFTDEVRYDVAVIRNRSALNPKRFYRGMDWKKKQGAPASGMIQVGTVVVPTAGSNPNDLARHFCVRTKYRHKIMNTRLGLTIRQMTRTNDKSSKNNC